MKKTIVLLDSHAMLHRSYHAFPYLTTPNGEPSGALFGVSQMLVHVMSDFLPHDVIACFDLPDDTFRHTAYDGYKAGRQKTEDALSLQIARAPGIMDAWSIPVIAVPGFEADDCIGTLALQYHALGYRVVIASGDRDTLQMVRGDDIVVWTLKKNIKESIIFNETAVNEYYGFGPTLIPDYKALAGDSSDNIPGIKGIGDKTARILVAALGSIENIYATIDTDPDRVRSLVSKRMYELLVAGREEADFSRILGEIRIDVPVDIIEHATDWISRASMDSIASICRTYSFSSLLPRISDLFGVAGASQPDGTDAASSEPEIVIDNSELRSLQVARWLVDSTRNEESLQSMLRWAGVTTVPELWKVLQTELEQAQSVFVWEVIEQPLLAIVHTMHERGMQLDTDRLSVIGRDIHRRLDNARMEIYDLAGVEFNINSPKQLGEILFDTMGISAKGIKKNKSGGYSTQESELEKMSKENPIIEHILEYRGMSKLLSTYVDSLPRFCDSNSRIHPVLKQDGAATGRFSCTDPNIQNIPIRSDVGRSLRTAFTAAQGYTMVRFDYSQIELRLGAMLANEESMCELFRSGADIHTAVAARVFSVPEADVTSDQRRRAKVINFGILYGMGASALAVELGTLRSEAEDYLMAYFARFPRLREYAEENIQRGRTDGYTVTLFGRRRTIPEFSSGNKSVQAYAERIAMNAPIQGTAADVMKLGMIEAQKVCIAHNAYMIAQVHDELLFEVPEDNKDDFVIHIKTALESVLEIYAADKNVALVPLVVEGGYGPSWGEISKSL